jgi:uncharacterized protein with PIN domain
MELNKALFRFYEELNDFLPGYRKQVEFPYTFTGNPAVKDAIESIGVPHVEIDLILVNSYSVDFMYRIRDQDRISVYPVFESLDISEVQRLRPTPLRKPKFVLDVHLGRLAKYMRLCGLDTLYEQGLTDREIVIISLAQKRSILTRDKGLLKSREVTHGRWIRNTRPDEQLMEVIEAFDLKGRIDPFSRCLECNELLDEVRKEEISGKLPARTREYFRRFRQCPACKRIYWEGSHYERMKKFIADRGLITG